MLSTSRRSLLTRQLFLAFALSLPCSAPPQALVDFPGQTRRTVSFKRMVLTDYTVDIPRLAKKAVLKKAVEEAGEQGRQGHGYGHWLD